MRTPNLKGITKIYFLLWVGLSGDVVRETAVCLVSLCGLALVRAISHQSEAENK